MYLLHKHYIYDISISFMSPSVIKWILVQATCITLEVYISFVISYFNENSFLLIKSKFFRTNNVFFQYSSY